MTVPPHIHPSHHPNILLYASSQRSAHPTLVGSPPPIQPSMQKALFARPPPAPTAQPTNYHTKHLNLPPTPAKPPILQILAGPATPAKLLSARPLLAQPPLPKRLSKIPSLVRPSLLNPLPARPSPDKPSLETPRKTTQLLHILQYCHPGPTYSTRPRRPLLPCFCHRQHNSNFYPKMRPTFPLASP